MQHCLVNSQVLPFLMHLRAVKVRASNGSADAKAVATQRATKKRRVRLKYMVRCYVKN